MTLQADTSIAAGDGQVAAAALTAARSEASGDPQALQAAQAEAEKLRRKVATLEGDLVTARKMNTNIQRGADEERKVGDGWRGLFA